MFKNFASVMTLFLRKSSYFFLRIFFETHTGPIVKFNYSCVSSIDNNVFKNSNY